MRAIECKLHPYQQYSVEWIIDHPYCGLFLDMGLGKTLSTLTALDELIAFGQVGKILVIAPLKVAEKTWSDEIEKWDHLQHMTYSKILGTPKKRLEALHREADIYITNRENVAWLVEHYKAKWPFDTVVVDELSSFKSSQAKRFRALRKVRPKMKRVIGLTGTPAPNTLIDLWPQMYLLDQGERLEQTITKYRNTYFKPDRMNGHIVYSYRLLPGASDLIYDKIGDICVSMKAKDHLNLPPRTDNVIEVDLKPKEQALYKQLERDYVLSLNEDEIFASNAAVLSGKLLQMASGAVYDDQGKTQKIHDGKIEALERIVEEAQGEPILVFYSYQHDLVRIQAKFPEAQLLTTQNMDAWNRGEIPILLAHPQSAGHGLNLQAGGHIIVWFSMIWSLEYYQQANARLDRQGQKNPVVVHHLVTKGTVDELALQRLKDKDMNQEALLASLKAKIKEAKNERC